MYVCSICVCVYVLTVQITAVLQFIGFGRLINATFGRFDICVFVYLCLFFFFSHFKFKLFHNSLIPVRVISNATVCVYVSVCMCVCVYVSGSVYFLCLLFIYLCICVVRLFIYCFFPMFQNCSSGGPLDICSFCEIVGCDANLHLPEAWITHSKKNNKQK
jgi:hypothetical protein